MAILFPIADVQKKNQRTIPIEKILDTHIHM
jgi:hypothetical protein